MKCSDAPCGHQGGGWGFMEPISNPSIGHIRRGGRGLIETPIEPQHWAYQGVGGTSGGNCRHRNAYRTPASHILGGGHQEETAVIETPIEPQHQSPTTLDDRPLLSLVCIKCGHQACELAPSPTHSSSNHPAPPQPAASLVAPSAAGPTAHSHRVRTFHDTL